MYYNPIKMFIDYLRYREAVRKADQQHQETGERYYVLPMYGTDKPKLFITDRQNFKVLKRKHYINKDAKVVDLINESFYFTAYRNGNGFLDAKGKRIKRLVYFTYCANTRNLHKQQKKLRKQKQKKDSFN